jgi:LCP family protein required for cell wall assembly
MRLTMILLLLLLVVLLGVTAAGIYVIFTWEKPLGPALNLPTYTAPIAQPSLNATQVSLPLGSNASTTIQPDTTSQAVSAGQPSQPTVTQAPTSQPLCSGPSTMTLLVIGSDARSSGYMYGLADSIHVMRIDFSVPNVMVVDFPRDLWVEIPGISAHHGITNGKLNQAYLFGNPGMGYYDGAGEGPGLLAQTLDFNYGMRVDHYIAVNRQTFVKMIDAVGGVDVTLKSAVDLNSSHGTPDPRLVLPAGTSHLDGEIALKLASNRVPTTFQRMKYEKLILSALREKLLTPEMLPKLPLLAARFIGSVQTDLSVGDISSLICIAQAIPKENIMADSFPQEMFASDVTYDENRNVTTYVDTVDVAKLRAMVADFMNGIWPMP